MEHLKNSGDKTAAEFEDEMRNRQYLSMIMHTKIAIGQIAPPNLMAAMALFVAIEEELVRRGFKLDPRHQEKLRLTAYQCTLDYAMEVVFFTDTILPYGTAFNPRDMHKCAPFMVCTEQITYYALTQLSTLYVHPLMNTVIKVSVLGAHAH